MNEQFWWFVARSSGMVAWALITLALVWGVLLATRVLKPYDKPGWLLDLHRWLGALTVGFIAVHLVALVADNYVTFTLLDLAVPFGSDYQRFAVGLGVLAMYLLIVVQVSSIYMRKIPKRWWRAIHVWSYVAVLLTSWHAVLAGTDISRGFYAVAAVILSITPAIALTIRIVKRPVRATAKPRRERATATADQA
jgi:methionine sulfoxide reductase heme-binding subunit